MFVEVDQQLNSGGSSPRDDLRDAALPFKTSERGYEYTFQQHERYELFQWFRRSGVSWNPCGPVLSLSTHDALKGDA